MVITQKLDLVRSHWQARSRRVPMLGFVMGTIITAVVIAFLTIGFFCANLLYDHKQADSWSIMMLELDNLISVLYRDIEHGSEKYSEYHEDPAKKGVFTRISGTFLEKIDFNGMEASGGSDGWFIEHEFNFFAVNGASFVVKRIPGNTMITSFRAYPVALASLIPNLEESGGTMIYAGNRANQLIFSNSDEISSENFPKQSLLRRFIMSPLQVGQLTFNDASGNSHYGFFREVPHSNLVFFAEAPVSRLTTGVYEILAATGAILLGLLVAVLVAARIPLAIAFKPLSTLADITRKIGEGRFDVKIEHRGIGEVLHLSKSIGLMTDGLIKRDHEIAALMEEQKEKIRLESEVAIAKAIQENFLPPKSTQMMARSAIASTYVPADEVAGDWFGVAERKAEIGSAVTQSEVIVCLADVSGHGVGASMFTAVIAGVFDQYFAKEPKDDAPQVRQRIAAQEFRIFAQSLSGTMLRIGKSKWHATMALARYSPAAQRMSITNCGHPFPVHVSRNEAGKVTAKQLSIGGDCLGLSAAPEPESMDVDFRPGDYLVLFSDCLVESENPDGQPFSTRRLLNTIKASGDIATAEGLKDHIVGQWRTFIGTQKQDDDLSLIVLRADT